LKIPFTASSKDVIHPLFKQQDATSWKCKLCSKISAQPLGKAYTNLVDHFLRKLGVKATDEFSEKASKPENRELSFCDHALVRKNTKLSTISANTMLLNMDLLSDDVRYTIIAEPKGKKIGLAFDAWSANGHHFVAVMAIEALPLFDDALDKNENDSGQLCFIVGNNASVNGSIERKIKLPLIGCASHRLNLAVQSHIAQYDKEVEKVAALMRLLQTSKQKTVLRKMECSMPVIKNPTRWSSSYRMINRNLEMTDYIDGMGTDLTALLPAPREKIKLKSRFEDLGKF
ncbi:hypothetical protein GN958_ATG09156, partial [Phytophthora infestans]